MRQLATEFLFQQSEVFRMFHNSGRPPILIGLYGIKVLIAIVAIFLNGNLAWVTFKSKWIFAECENDPPYPWNL